jgi:hypothetical protein
MSGFLISSQWASQKNRLAFIFFGKIQFLSPCIFISPVQVVTPQYGSGLDADAKICCRVSIDTTQADFLSRLLFKTLTYEMLSA